MNYKLVVDFRENHSTSKIHNITPKLDEAGIDYEQKQLDVGDFLIVNNNTGAISCIEKKIMTDLVGSLYNGRLQNELYNMSQKYEKNFLIIVGELSDLYKSRAKAYKMGHVKNVKVFSKSQLLGIMASVSARYDNIKFLQVKNDEEFIDLLMKLGEKITDGKEIKCGTINRVKSSDNTYKNVLMAFKGISQEKAEKIIEKYNSWPEFVNSIKDNTFRLSGFGKKSIEMFEKFVIGEKAKV